MTVRVVNGHELDVYIAPSEGIGVFGFTPRSGQLYTVFFPEQKFVVATPNETREEPETIDATSVLGCDRLAEVRQLVDIPDKVETAPAKVDLLFTLGVEHRAELLRLSIIAIRDQIDRYQSHDFKSVLSPLLKDDERYKLEVGCGLIRTDLNDNFGVIATSLLSELDYGLDRFYNEYLNVLRRFSPYVAESFESAVNGNVFIEEAIQPYVMVNEGFSASTSLLVANWIKPIIDAIWSVHEYSSKWALGLRRNIPDTLLHLSSSEMPTVGSTIEPRYTVPKTLIDPFMGERLVWFDASRFSHAGLSPKAVEFVLEQHDQALLIDVVKLLVAKYTESPLIQELCKFDEPRRYAGLTDELSERYGITNNSITRQKVKAACHFLDALRWGPSFEKHVKFFSFETGLREQDELTVSYMKGFTKPLQSAERIVPMINHPKGSTRSRATYNRQGLSLASWLVENSQLYLRHEGSGIPLDERAIHRFMSQVGYSRKRSLNSVLSSFEDYGAIEINDGLIKLGEKNQAEERLILEGAHYSRQGRKGGQISAKKRRDKFKP
tara:strand:+ start:1138 stop:2790 length:1653 start_codon:yes stop_codon:yes gene_type:complete